MGRERGGRAADGKFRTACSKFSACERRKMRKKCNFWSPFLSPFFDPAFGPQKKRTLLRGPKSGVKKRAQKRRPEIALFFQVNTYFSWINCAVDAAEAQKKEPVVINCDETAIAFCYTGRKGNVV